MRQIFIFRLADFDNCGGFNELLEICKNHHETYKVIFEDIKQSRIYPDYYCLETIIGLEKNETICLRTVELLKVNNYDEFHKLIKEQQ